MTPNGLGLSLGIAHDRKPIATGRPEVRRGEGVEGGVRRRGFSRPRYEGEIAGGTWHFSKLAAPVSGIRDPEDRELATLTLTERGVG